MHGSDHYINSNTHHHECRAEPSLGDFVQIHSSALPQPPLPITFQTQGSAASPSRSLSAAQGMGQRESQGHPWLRHLTPTTVETQQASWRQTQTH